jgi:uncharacterized protein YaaQ
MSKMQSTPIDRLLILVLSGAQSAALTKRLSEEKFYFTLIDSHGGLMEDQTICLLLGVYQQRMPELLESANPTASSSRPKCSCRENWQTFPWWKRSWAARWPMP